jgi:poly-gamma-glutamate synthesis protein (capsule biosynthesis protein)
VRSVLIGLLGDVMLGRKVGEAIRRGAPGVVDPALVAVLHEADVLVANLECCISARGERWPDPQKPFFFRAPPRAVDVLTTMGVDVITLANNHALDYGPVALVDTLTALDDAGIVVVGAGEDTARARAAGFVAREGFRLAVIGCTDHPAVYAARRDRPGVAYADLRSGVPSWLRDAVAGARGGADGVLVTPHWGPNMAAGPAAYIRRAARALRAAGAALVAGHSAHVFHGIENHVCYDLGDFVDDYASDPVMRNDLGIAVFVDWDEARGPVSATIIPLALDYCRTRLAAGDDARWVTDRMREACRDFATRAHACDGRLVVDLQERS